MRRLFTKSRKVGLAYPRPNFARQLKGNEFKGLNSVLQVRMVAIRMIPLVKMMMICNSFHCFQCSFSFLTFSRLFFGRGWRTFVYKIVCILVSISCTEVIERSLDASFTSYHCSNWKTSEVARNYSILKLVVLSV